MEPGVSYDVLVDLADSQSQRPMKRPHQDPSELSENEYKKKKETTDGCKELFVQDLNVTTSEGTLLTYFHQFGPVQKCHINRNMETGQPLGFGTVTMVESESAQKVLTQAVHVVENRCVCFIPFPSI